MKEIKEKNKTEIKSNKEIILPLKNDETKRKSETKSKTNMDKKEEENTNLETKQNTKETHENGRKEEPTQQTKEDQCKKSEEVEPSTDISEIKKKEKETEKMETKLNEMEIKFNKLKKILTQNQDKVKEDQESIKKTMKEIGINEGNEIESEIEVKENGTQELECKPPPRTKMNERMQEKGEPPPERTLINYLYSDFYQKFLNFTKFLLILQISPKVNIIVNYFSPIINFMILQLFFQNS